MKEYIAQSQPLFYQLIHQELSNKKIPHAFLLVGNQTEKPLQFLAMSLICKEDVLACETCNDCRRVKEYNYPDLIHFNGKEETIKKGQIETIQETFKKSSVEGSVKIYILENIENATKEAMNSLLKMLEEPMCEIYAIFTTKNIHRVLPTIQSRCQVIEIKPEKKEVFIEELKKEGFESVDAKILAELTSDKDQAKNMKDDRFDYFKLQVINTVEDIFFKKDNLIINTQTNLLKKYTNKEDIRLFLNILVIALKDVFHVKHQLPICFDDQKDLFQSIQVDNRDIIKKIEYILEANYALESNANVMLLMDSLLYRL